jgi:hypothetical protein
MQALNMLKERARHSPVSCSMDMVRGNPTLSPAREQASTSATGALPAPATALRGNDLMGVATWSTCVHETKDAAPERAGASNKSGCTPPEGLLLLCNLMGLCLLILM